MKTTSKIFSYTARRGTYITTMSALLFIMIVEGGVFAFLIARLIPDELINLALLGLSAALYLLISSKLLAPLWTKHRLNATGLQLQYGLDFRVSVPRNTIIAAQQVRERVALPVVRYEAEKQRIVAVFSEQGQVLLRLDQPYPFRISFFKKVLADQILINVNQRDELLAALDLPAAGTQRPALLAKAQPGPGESLHPLKVIPPEV